MSGEQLLFNSGDLRATLENIGHGLTEEVESVPEDHLLQADEDEWVRALVERYSVEVPVLKADSAWMDEPVSVQVDVSWDHFNRAIFDPSTPTYTAGHRTVVHIPFDGDHEVFLLQPSSFTFNPPRANFSADELTLVIEYPDDRPADIKSATDGLVSSVQKYLVWSTADIAAFNSGLEPMARSAIQTRRERVRRHREHLATTGLPVGPPDTSAKTYIAGAVIRRPAPVLPSTPQDRPMSLEPVLADDVYDHILSVIRMSAVGMERSPKTYMGMNEEARRQVLLDALNTHYRGEGAAEAFNVGGKTDILVRHEGRNLFIAECKFWSGAKGFTETIDQLFGYQAWRDTKLAVIMFVREKGLTDIIKRGRETLEQHPQFVEWQEADNETELRAKVCWGGDSERRADLNVFLVSTPK